MPSFHLYASVTDLRGQRITDLAFRGFHTIIKFGSKDWKAGLETKSLPKNTKPDPEHSSKDSSK